MFRTELRHSFEQFHSSEFSLDVLLTWGTRRFGFVKVEHEPRRIGKSNYTSAQLVRHAINMVTGFTTGPLRLASLIGFSATIVGLGALAYVLGNYVMNGTAVPGFAFIGASVAFFSGVQLFALGVIGEYLAKVHNALDGEAAVRRSPDGRRRDDRVRADRRHPHGLRSHRMSRNLSSVLSASGPYELFQSALGAHASRRRLVQDFIRPEPGDRILDAGCGPAAILDALPADVSYVGFDAERGIHRERNVALGRTRPVLRRRCRRPVAAPTCSASSTSCSRIGVLHHLDDGEVGRLCEQVPVGSTAAARS